MIVTESVAWAVLVTRLYWRALNRQTLVPCCVADLERLEALIGSKIQKLHTTNATHSVYPAVGSL